MQSRLREELADLHQCPANCVVFRRTARTKAQRSKCADRPQISNIKHKFIKGAALVPLTTTKHKFEIIGPSTRDLNFVKTCFCKTMVRLGGVKSQSVYVFTVNYSQKY